MKKNILLIYVGKGDSAIGVPARDLTQEEVAECGGAEYLLSNYPNLYKPNETELQKPEESEEVEAQPKAKTPKSKK